MPFIIKVNLRHTTTGGKIRTIRNYNNFVYHKKFNSLASTFEFDYWFDPRNQEHAEIICVTHLHEVRLYYTSNTDPNYEPKESERELTGFMLRTKFKNNGKPQFVNISGYSKPGVLLNCSIPPDQYPLETDGLTFKQVLLKTIKPFNLWASGDPSTKNGNSPGLVVDKGANVSFTAQTEKFSNKEDLDELDQDVGKTACDTAQQIDSYLTEIAKAQNIVLSHNAYGNVYVCVPNTNGKPIFNFDFTDPDENSDVKKIPGVESDLDFNAEGLHTHITVKQQSDDEEGSNGSEATIRNPLLPVGKGFVYRPLVVDMKSGDQFTAEKFAKYNLGKEIRDSIPLVIKCGKIDIAGKLISPNNTIKVKDPNQYLYNNSVWFIQDCVIKQNEKGEEITMNCVLPFGYDYDLKKLKNVFVDPHENLPRI